MLVIFRLSLSPAGVFKVTLAPTTRLEEEAIQVNQVPRRCQRVPQSNGNPHRCVHVRWWVLE